LPDFVYFDRREYLFGLIEHGIRLILGLLLVFKAKGLAYLLDKIRKFGFRKTENAEMIGK